MESLEKVIYATAIGTVIVVLIAVWLLLLYWLLRGIVHLALALPETNQNWERKRKESPTLRIMPTNVLLHPECLTEKGRTYRKEGIKYILRVIIPCVGLFMTQKIAELILNL